MIDKKIFHFDRIRIMLITLAGLAFLQGFCVIGQAIFLAQCIVNVWDGKPIPSQFANLFFFFLCFVARAACKWIKEKLLDTYAYTQVRNMRNKLLTKIFTDGSHLVGENGIGNTVTSILDGIPEMQTYIQLTLSKLLDLAIIPLLILATIIYFDRLSGLVLFLVFPFIILFMILLGFAAQKKAERQYFQFELLNNHFIDALRGIETLKLFGLSKAYTQSIYQTSEKFRKATMNTLRVAILSTFALDFFTTLSVAIVAVFLGIRLLHGEILFFTALTTLILAPEYFLPLREFAGDYHATLNGKNAMNALYKLLDKETSTNKDVLQEFEWTKNSSLSIQNLDFHYSEEKVGLKNINLSVAGFQKIGIVGKSGSGKSTLIHLLAGFINEDEQDITVNQTKIPHFAQTKWQEKLQLLPQQTTIFSASLRENICFYTPNATDEAIQNAIHASGLTSFVENLPEGLDTLIGQSGRSLSAGQAQRVALARAFLSESRNILLFDEPTSHLDIETELEIKENILPLLENKLVFFATHRLHWMKEMDVILVMEDGQIVASGTHENLEKTSPQYQAFIQEVRGERS